MRKIYIIYFENKQTNKISLLGTPHLDIKSAHKAMRISMARALHRLSKTLNIPEEEFSLIDFSTSAVITIPLSPVRKLPTTLLYKYRIEELTIF